MPAAATHVSHTRLQAATALPQLPMSNVGNLWRLTDSEANTEVGKDQTIDIRGKRNLWNSKTKAHY